MTNQCKHEQDFSAAISYPMGARRIEQGDDAAYTKCYMLYGGAYS